MAKQAIDEFNDYFTEKKREKEAAAKALRKRIEWAVETVLKLRIRKMELQPYEDVNGDSALRVEIWLRKEERKLKDTIFGDIVPLVAQTVRDADDSAYPVVVPHLAKGQPLDSKLA